MNIVIVNPSVRPYMDKAYFPTGLCYIGTVMQQAGYEFDVIDVEAHRYSEEKLEELFGKKFYDIILMGTLVSAYKYAKSILEIARKLNPNATIVVGNSIASSIPEHLLTHTQADIGVKGEGEVVILNLLKALENNTPLEGVKGIVFLRDGKLVDTGYEESIQDIDTIPLPNWDIFDMEVYLSKAILDVSEPYPMPVEQIRPFIVIASRGCPYRCTFCYHVFHYTKYRYRSMDNVFLEIDQLQKRYGVNYITFYDELTFFNQKRLEDFVEAKIARRSDFYWRGYTRGGVFKEKDLPLLIKARENGCLGLFYALESGNPDILKAMNKHMKVEDFIEQKRVLDKAKIPSRTFLVIGFPGETLDTLKQSFDVCYEVGIYPSVGYLLPQPQTPIFDLAVEKGLIANLEDYLIRMGDRQDLTINLSGIPDAVLEEEVTKHLGRISDKLELGFKRGQLIKTGKMVLTYSSQEILLDKD